MRAIAVPKYDTYLIASSSCPIRENSDDSANSMLAVFKTATLSIGDKITFYIDSRNLAFEDGGGLCANLQ